MGSGEAFRQAAAIVREQAAAWDRVVVVVSAMSGVTDALVRGARTAAAGDGETYGAIAAELRARHRDVVGALPSLDGEGAALLADVDGVLDAFATFCRSVHVLGEATPRAMDAISSLGERLSAGILAAQQRGQDADARPVMSPMRQRYVHSHTRNPKRDRKRSQYKDDTCRRVVPMGAGD